MYYCCIVAIDVMLVNYYLLFFCGSDVSVVMFCGCMCLLFVMFVSGIVNVVSFLEVLSLYESVLIYVVYNSCLIYIRCTYIYFV